MCGDACAPGVLEVRANPNPEAGASAYAAFDACIDKAATDGVLEPQSQPSPKTHPHP